ncbi:MAG: hypothetical protein RL681_615 [Candidatus Parcubacteria bacterium]|jgi:hypothetical protein
MGYSPAGKRWTAIIAVALLCIAFLPGPISAHAAADETTCQFADSIKELEALRTDYYGDPAFRIRTELAIRKKILFGIIDCAVDETRTLKDKVDEVPADNGSIAPIRTRFLSMLDSALQYYADARSRVDTLGIGGSKDLAREIRTWRTNTYTPTATQALNFLVWAKNQELFAAGNDRLADIQAAIRALKLTEDEKARALLEESVLSLKSANEENDRVRTELDQFPPPPNTLDAIQRSLEKLSHTYELFFSLSELAQKLIPLGEKK